MFKPFFLTLCIVSFAYNSSTSAQTVIDFEGVGESLANDTAYRGEDDAKGFQAEGATFNNSYDATYDAWNGFAYSNRTSWNRGGTSGYEEFQFGNDTAVASPTGVSGAGFDGSDTWAVAFGFAQNESRIAAPAGAGFQSLYVNNTRTTYDVILNGNGSSTAFGPNDEFGFRLHSLQMNGIEALTILATSEPIPLANNDTIVNDWTLVDLTGTNLEGANLLGIEYYSTKVGPFGINTPTYVAIDNITLIAVPEPGSLSFVGMLGTCLLLRRRRN